MFDTATGACLLCLAAIAQTDTPLRLQYRQSQATMYPDTCDRHGPTLRLVHNNACLQCLDKRRDPFRIAARRAGDSQYEQYCATHDAYEPHWVETGKCATCFSRSGVRRVRFPDTNPARLAARAAGLTTYLRECPIHGEYPHSVDRGKCLGCFTTSGKVRKR